MFPHVPRKLPGSFLRWWWRCIGCTQTANVYDHGSGWSALADAQGFVLVFRSSNAPTIPTPASTGFFRRMPGATKARPCRSARWSSERSWTMAIHRRRVFIVGLSAGGAMVSAMLVAYPEVFAGGAIVAGLPYGCAANVQEAFEAMARGRDHGTRTWGNFVRSASPHRGPWPRLSIWHGTSDTIVNPKNMEDSLRQWLMFIACRLARALTRA